MYRVGMTILVYLRLKLSLSSLAMVIASTKDFLVAGYPGCDWLCMDLIGLVLPPALGGLF